MAEGFKVNLEYLRRTHDEKLPLAIGNLDSALAALQRASEETAAAFEGKADLCRGAEQAWGAMNNFLARIMERNRETLDLTREAIKQVHQRYSELEGIE